MKRICHCLCMLCISLYTFSQSFQGTIKQGSQPNQIICAIKPNMAFTGKPVNLQFAFSIPNTFVPRPVLTVDNNIYASFFDVSGVSVVQNASYNGEYIYLVNLAISTFSDKIYTANTEDHVLELSFSGSNPTASLKLVQLPDGVSQTGASDENGNYNFYTEFLSGDLTNAAAFFYSGSGGIITNNPGYGSYSFVMLGSAPLPLTWINFDAHLKNKSAQLFWEVAHQINNKQFEVERSMDGSQFKSIAVIPATSETRYQFDDKLSHYMGGIAYYRIRQLDIDGKFSYSPIRKVNLDDRRLVVSVISDGIDRSPVRIRIQSGKANSGKAELFDGMGRKIYSETVFWGEGTTETIISSPVQASGIYILTLSVDGIMYTVKMIK